MLLPFVVVYFFALQRMLYSFIPQTNCCFDLPTFFISAFNSVMYFHHLSLIKHITTFSHIFKKYYFKFQLPNLTNCVAFFTTSLPSFLFLVPVWVEVMFESDNTRKPKDKKKEMWHSSVLQPSRPLVCIMLLFPEITPEHPPGRQYALDSFPFIFLFFYFTKFIAKKKKIPVVAVGRC